MKNRFKKFLLSTVVSVALLSGSITAFAAPSLVTIRTDFSDPSIPTSVPVATYSGKGDSVIQNISLPSGFAYKISFTHDGTSNFIVQFINGTEKDYLANKIGEYAGTALLEDGSTAARESCMFNVKADGNWTITISTITNATSRSMAGTGDKVTGLFTLTNLNNVVTLNNTGDGNFIVWCNYSDGNKELLANTIGAYSGQVVMKANKNCYYYLDVHSTGAWSVDMGYGEGITTTPDIN